MENKKKWSKENMSYKVHKTFGGFDSMGFKFNYPKEGAVFDIEHQRFAEIVESHEKLTDEQLLKEFVFRATLYPKSIFWRDIKRITRI